MHINGINISKFGAKVQNKSPTHKSKKRNVKAVKNKIIKLNESQTFGDLPIEILFEAITRDEVHKNISKFLKETIECDIKFKNLSNNYKCYYVDHDIEESKIDEWLFLKINFLYYEYGNEITKEFLNVGEIVNIGNEVAPCIIELTSKIDLIDLELHGVSDEKIILKNIKANKVITLNGINDTVLQEGVNKFSDSDLWEYPRLLPGENNIRSNRDSLNIKVKYNPIWI